MNKFFSNNVIWKTAAIVSALVLWLFVINTQNPPKSYDMRNREISFRGVDLLQKKGYVIKDEIDLREQKVRVVVRGPRLQIDKIRDNPELIEIKVDITKYVNNITANMDMVAPTIPIDVSVPLGLTIVEQSPENLEIIFEREKTVTKTIEYAINAGSNKEYEALIPKIVPETIDIWGAESYMDEIHEVRIDIDVENFSEDVLTYQTPIKVYDVDGNELKELNKSHSNAEVTLPLGKKKTVPLEMQFVGKLPEGFIQTGVGVYPQSITIIGKPSLVDTITSIKLAEVSLENIIETSKINTKFILPPGISYLDRIENSATITIRIKEQAIYDYSLDISKAKVNIINKRDGFKYEILDNEIKVKVKSIAENLLNTNSRDVGVSINVDGYSEGEYEIGTNLEFPPDITVVEEPNITVKITKEVLEEPELDPNPNLDPNLDLNLNPDIDLPPSLEPDLGLPPEPDTSTEE